jgi:HK97 family phage portal protein
MSFLDKFFRPHVTKEPAVPYLYNYQAVPPSRDMSGYISAFGEVGWLYAVVSKIAQCVSDAKWSIYSQKNGEETEVERSPIMDVLNFVNPFQTFQEFIELHEIYMGLAGECFWVVNKNKGGMPGELWIVPPDKMSVVPSKKDFIAGYIYKVGNESIPLDKELVIHFKLPNPMNPYRGLGPVQAMAQDLDGEINATKWNNKFFYNSARPDVVMFPEGDVSEEYYIRLKEQFKERHQGVLNSNRMAIASGIRDIKLLSISAKDMDFKELRLLNRDNILGIFGMPLSVMGITENVNRANAEAGDYTFARWIVQPRLNRIKNKLNEQFLPMFPNSQNLCLDFDDVVPESVEENRALAESGIKSGYMKINEARELAGLDSLGPEGDVLVAPQANPFNGVTLSAKKKVFSPEWKETYWRGYVTRAEAYEKKMILALKDMFSAQESEAISKLEAGSRDLIDQAEAKVSYMKAVTPILTDLMKLTIENGRELINPKPHKDAPPEQPMSEAARKWLLTRIAWAAVQIGEETAGKLSVALATGFEAGESIPGIAKRVRDVFEGFSRARSILIARTETLSASAQGAIEGYKEAEVKQAEVLAAYDDRTCEDCDSLSGEVFDLDDCTGVLPVHCDCRCCWLPVV